MPTSHSAATVIAKLYVLRNEREKRFALACFKLVCRFFVPLGAIKDACNFNVLSMHVSIRPSKRGKKEEHPFLCDTDRTVLFSRRKGKIKEHMHRRARYRERWNEGSGIGRIAREIELDTTSKWMRREQTVENDKIVGKREARWFTISLWSGWNDSRSIDRFTRSTGAYDTIRSPAGSAATYVAKLHEFRSNSRRLRNNKYLNFTVRTIPSLERR